MLWRCSGEELEPPPKMPRHGQAESRLIWPRSPSTRHGSTAVLSSIIRLQVWSTPLSPSPSQIPTGSHLALCSNFCFVYAFKVFDKNSTG
jgi:hypothetical protein